MTEQEYLLVNDLCNVRVAKGVLSLLSVVNETHSVVNSNDWEDMLKTLYEWEQQLFKLCANATIPVEDIVSAIVNAPKMPEPAYQAACIKCGHVRPLFDGLCFSCNKGAAS
jgi:hypothetical protein